MENNLLYCVCWADVLASVIITVFITLVTYFIIYNIVPKLTINNIEWCDKYLAIQVVNLGRFKAVNLRIEVCAMVDDKTTLHFQLDHENFLILPNIKSGDNLKIFHINNIASSAKPYIENYEKLLAKIKDGTYNRIRVRIHSYHEFSGLGKVEEASFNFQNDKFIKVKS